ncbi:MAG: hypothetical protein ACAI25_04210 [Planctomycetota bacterium]
MPDERGEFTRKFDRDVLKDETAAVEELEAQKKRQLEEEAGLESEFVKLSDILVYRAKWLSERFPGVVESAKVDFKGKRFEFPKRDKVGPGWMEFRSRLTETGLGITLECYMQLDGKFSKRYDYVNFPKTGVDVARAKKFVENKIFEFAMDYQAKG